jgi:protein-disulfide isomerase
MSKQPRDVPDKRGPAVQRSVVASSGMLWFAALAGAGVLLFVGIENWMETRQLQRTLDVRLGQIETRLTQLSAKVDAAPQRAAQPARRGPDPNKVYAVKTDGRPYKGPKNAPVTIAEFSDFQ